jgi:hypothetical protein
MGVYWGAILGLIGGVSSGVALLYLFWEHPGNFQMLPEYWWFVNKDEEKENDY